MTISTLSSTSHKTTSQKRYKAPKSPNGVVLYRGPSLLTGKPIVVIAVGLTKGSTNEKTGAMVQTYILSDEGMKPTDALNSGKDESVCGNCPHRPWYLKIFVKDRLTKTVREKLVRKGGSCYVNVGQGANMVWSGLMRGIYPTMNPSIHLHLFERMVRFGTYGDPAAVPYRVWHLLSSVCKGRTGYTHQWRNCDQRLKGLLMASADSSWQADEAREMGWRYFRVRLANQPISKGEIVCPASAEAGKRRTCETCLACDGQTKSGKGVSVVIMVHGSSVGKNYKARRFEQIVTELEAQSPKRFSLSVL